MGSQVGGAGSDNISGLSGDESTVGVGYETGESWSVVWGNCGSWGNKRSSMGSQVLSAGSDNISGLSWDYGTVGVGDEWGKWISKMSSISKMSGISSIGTSVWVSSTITVTGISAPSSISQTSPCAITVGKSLGGKVSSLSSGDLWGLSWGYGTIGVGDELCAGNSDASEENLKLNVNSVTWLLLFLETKCYWKYVEIFD